MTPIMKSLKEILDEAESITIHNTLRLCKYNKTQAASVLGIARKTLYNKIKKYKL